VSQYPQRSGQPVRRTNTVGSPTRLVSPCSEKKISVIRSVTCRIEERGLRIEEETEDMAYIANRTEPIL